MSEPTIPPPTEIGQLVDLLHAVIQSKASHSGTITPGPATVAACSRVRDFVEGIIRRRHAAEAECDSFRSENDVLRGVLAKANIPCLHCGLTDMSKCASGFPGCAKADDMMVGEDAAFRLACERMKTAEAERDAAIKVVDENWVSHQQLIAMRQERDAALAAVARWKGNYDSVVAARESFDATIRAVCLSIAPELCGEAEDGSEHSLSDVIRGTVTTALAAVEVARREEREVCAKVAESDELAQSHGGRATAREIAASIRSRTTTTPDTDEITS